MNFEGDLYFMMLLNAFGLIIGITNEAMFIVVAAGSRIASAMFGAYAIGTGVAASQM